MSVNRMARRSSGRGRQNERMMTSKETVPPLARCSAGAARGSGNTAALQRPSRLRAIPAMRCAKGTPRRPPTDIFAARIGSTLHSGRWVIYSASSHSAMPKMLWVGIANVQHLRHLSLPGFAQVLKAISGISRSYHTGRDVMMLSSTGRHCVIVCTLSMSLGCDRVYP